MKYCNSKKNAGMICCPFRKKIADFIEDISITDLQHSYILFSYDNYRIMRDEYTT